MAVDLPESPLTRVYAWFNAVFADDVTLMDDLLAHGVPVDVPHPLRHTTALMEATRRGNTATVHWLLARGATPALLCGTPLATPLHCAIGLHHTVVAMLLMNAGGNLAMADAKGRTPLHVLATESAEFPHIAEMMELAVHLIDKGCPLDTLDREGLTALHYAVINNQGHLAELLLVRGANANASVPDTHMSPLAMAALDKNTNLATLLMQYGANPHQQARGGVTPAAIFPALTRMAAGVPPEKTSAMGKAASPSRSRKTLVN